MSECHNACSTTTAAPSQLTHEEETEDDTHLDFLTYTHTKRTIKHTHSHQSMCSIVPIFLVFIYLLNRCILYVTFFVYDHFLFVGFTLWITL